MIQFRTIQQVVTLLVLGAVVFAGVAQTRTVTAAFNPEINYQGKLATPAGSAVADGTYAMTFRLYTVATSGAAVWTEARTGANEVTVTNGLFSIMLGSVTSLAGVNFDQTLYLGVTIESDSEMSPRKILGAVPAAFTAQNANTVGGVASTSFVRSDEADTIAATTASTLLTITQNGTGDILNLFDGGTEVFTVLDGGNVGIGTSTPTAKFEVAGNAISTGVAMTIQNMATTASFARLNLTANGQTSDIFFDGSGGFVAGGGLILRTQVNRPMHFYVNNVSRMKIDTTGHVGIATSSPSALFTVAGDMRLTGRFADSASSTGSVGNILTATTNGTAWAATTSLGLSAAFSDSAGLAALLSDETGTGVAVFNASPTLTGTTTAGNATFSGNVGIGTTSPSRRLQVNSAGVAVVSDFYSGNTSAYLDTFGTGGVARMGWFNGVAGIAATGTTIPSLAVATSGNIGIGTTTPSALLQVAGSSIFGIAGTAIGTTSMTVRGDSGTPNAEIFSFNLQRSNYDPAGIGAAISFARGGGANDAQILFKTHNGTSLGERMRITATGNLALGTTTGASLLSVGATNGSQFLVSSAGVITDGTWQGDTIADTYITKTGDWTGTLDGIDGADYTREDLTYLGKTGNQSFDSVTDTAAEWSALPVGYSRMIATSVGTAGGAPVNNHGYFTKTANRDTQGGWGGLWIGYNAGQNYLGRSASSSNLATWDLLWSDANDGAGSTLDADLLDAQTGTYYLSRANHTGAQATSTITGVFGSVNGGTGLSTVTQNQLLIGGAGNTWSQVATSSLGLSAFFSDSAGLAALLSDETGTGGGFVRATSPLLSGITLTGTTTAAGATFSTFVGIGTTTPTAMLSVAGDVAVGTSTGGTIKSNKELVLMQEGDEYGASILRLMNRGGNNGAIFETTNPSVALVDFNFKTALETRNIRFESRVGAADAGSPAFHIGGILPDYSTFMIGDSMIRLGSGNFNIQPHFGDDAGDIEFNTSSSSLLGKIWTSTNATPGLFLATNATTPDLAIAASGHIGIGTTSPSSLLSVGATSSAQFLVSSAGVITDGTWQGDTIGGAYGGTGLSTVTQNQLLIGGAGNTWSQAATSSLGLGTVTSVSLTTPTGLTVSGSPITTSGTLALSLQAGYNIPLTASTTNWNDFYTTPSNRITAGTGLSWSGNTLNASAGSVYLASTTVWTTGNLARVAGNGTLDSVATSSLGLSAAFTNSAQLAALLSDETGSAGGGVAVFSASPTFTGTTTAVNGTFSGSVGIGVTNPATRLQVGADTAGQSNYVTLGKGFDAASGLSWQRAGVVDSNIYSDANEHLIFATDVSNTLANTTGSFIFQSNGGNELVRISSTGNVGIGTSSPSALLSIGATSSLQFLVSSAGVITDGTWQGDTIGGAYGGTGLSTVTQNQLLIGGAGNTWSQVATSSLGLSAAFTNSAQLAALLSDETGTGNVVFSANSTFTGTQTFANFFGTTATITSATTTNFASSRIDIAGDSITDFTGTGLTVTGNALTLNATGDWTGTFDGQEGTYYLSRANHTGTQATSTITGVFAVANGGTGAATLTGLVQGNGTGAMTAITNSTTVGQVLRVTGSNTYAWGALDLADTDAVTGILPDGNVTDALTITAGTINNTPIGATTANTAVFTNATSTSLRLTGAFRDTSNTAGTNGMVLQTTGTGVQWVATSSLGIGGLSTTQIDTSSELAGILTDETGTGGVAVFNSSPTFTGTITAAAANFSGNVGIGTTTPDSLLNLVGADPILLVKDTDTGVGTANSRIRLAESGSGGITDSYWDIKADGTIDTNFGFSIGNNTVANAFFIQRLSGNVGIGTTSPSAKFTVSGDMRLTGRFADSASSTGSVGNILSVGANGTLWTATSSLGLSAAFTNSAQLAALLSDETGTGNAVFSASPALTGNVTLSSPSTAGSGTTYGFLLTGDQSVANTGTLIGMISNQTYTHSGTLATMIGFRGEPENSSSGTITNLRGTTGQPQNNGTGNVTSMWGFYAFPEQVGSGTTTNMYGIQALPRSSGTGRVTNMYGGHFDCGASGASAVVTNCYGIWIDAPNLTGTVTNAYALWIDDNDLVIDKDGDGVFGGTTGSDLFIGEGQDLELYHDGTNSYIMNNTGELFVGGSTSTVDVILSANGGMVGIGATSSLEAKLHIRSTETSNVAISAGASDLLIEGTGNTGMTIISGGLAESKLHFGDSADPSIGQISYKNLSNSLEFVTNGTAAMTLNSSGNADISGTLTVGSFPSSGSRALCWDNAGASVVNDCSAAPIADYAEMYPAAANVDYGHIVALGTKMVPTYDFERDTGALLYDQVIGEVPEVVKADQGQVVLGVLSNNYEDFSSTGHNIKSEDNPKPVALVGRVPVKVNLEAGPIHVGDKITLSSVTGIGMKATKSGEVTVGIALENYLATTADGAILVFVGNDTNLTLADQLRAGLFSEDLESTAEVFDELLEDEMDTVWNRLTKLARGFTDGVLELTGFKAESIETELLCVGDTCITESQLEELLDGQNTAPAALPPAEPPAEPPAGGGEGSEPPPEPPPAEESPLEPPASEPPPEAPPEGGP